MLLNHAVAPKLSIIIKQTLFPHKFSLVCFRGSFDSLDSQEWRPDLHSWLVEGRLLCKRSVPLVIFGALVLGALGLLSRSLRNSWLEIVLLPNFYTKQKTCFHSDQKLRRYQLKVRKAFREKNVAQICFFLSSNASDLYRSSFLKYVLSRKKYVFVVLGLIEVVRDWKGSLGG